MAERSSWTDDRIDDLVAHLYSRFDRLDARMGRFEDDLREVRDELRDVRGELVAIHRQFALFGWGVVGAIIVQAIIAVTAALIASA
jgi:hypothetical protein